MKKESLFNLLKAGDMPAQIRDLIFEISTPKDESNILKENWDKFIPIIAVNAAKEIESISDSCYIVIDGFYYSSFEMVMIHHFIHKFLKSAENDVKIINILKESYEGFEKIFFALIEEFSVRYLTENHEDTLLYKDNKCVAIYNNEAIKEELYNFLNNGSCKNKKAALDCLSLFFHCDRKEINNILEFTQEEKV